MYDLSFYDLYNNFEYEINHEKPFNTLNEINSLFCEFGLRADENEIRLLEEKIFKMYEDNKDNISLESIIDCICTIQLHQPFYDGNHRTSILFFKLIMKELVPDFSYHATHQNNQFYNFFDIYYYDDEKPSQKNIESVNKYINKK